MDTQNKKIKMVDIVPLEENAKSVVLNQKPAPKKEAIKPLIPLADIKENIEKIESVPSAETKNITIEIDKKIKTVESVEEILKKPKDEKPLLLREKKSFGFKKLIVYFFIILALASVLYAAIYILPRAEITIITKKSGWNFNDIVRASKDESNINLTEKQIPAEIFKDVKTLTLSFPAHGKKYVERKAVGEVMVYNSYSSQPQTLIAGTRIESPDGKIFRLDKKITVPGAKIEEGKISASSIKATVTAEKAGEEYNIAPVKFTIPGFKGTAKYDGFYAVSNEAMKGGLVGDVLFPTEEDALAAKEKTSAQLSADMNTFLSSQFSGDFKILEWSKVFNLTKENIDKEADRNGNFLISLEGEMKIIAFRESDIVELMSKMAKETLGPTFEIKNYNLNYGTGQYDADNGRMAFNINFNGEFWQPINIESFKSSVINKKESDLKIFVFSIPGVEKATVSLWPIWVRKVPGLVDKVKVEIN